MAIKLYDDTNFVMIASAIRAKNGLETQYKPSEMATAINALKMAKDVEPNNTSSGLNVNFKDGADGEKYNSLILNIPPLQDGTGDPSPTNKRAFKDYARFILYYSGADKTDYETYTLNHSTLGGSIDLISGAESYFNISMRLANYSNSLTTYTEDGVTIFYLPGAYDFGDIYSESLKTVEKMSSLSEAAQNMPNNSIAGSKGAAQSSIGFFIRADSFSTVSELIASIGMDDNYPTTWMETNTITSGLFTGRTELGVNNLWAIGYQVYDEQLSQDIPLEVSYKADPILYTQGVIMNMLPQDQITGAVANFPDGSANPIVEGIFSIVPNQEGTGDPSPSNVRPISGFTGMNITRSKTNIWNEDWEVGGINDSTGVPNAETNKIRSKTFFRIKGGMTYYVVAPQAIRVLFYAEDESFISETQNISNSTFTAPSNATKAKIRGTNSYGTTYNNDIAINYPATVTTYEAYQAVTKSVTWADSAGTVYGGSLNLTTGVLTVTFKMVNLSGRDWDSGSPNQDGYIRFVNHTSIGDKANGYNLYCNILPVKSTLIPSSPTTIGISGYSGNANIYMAISSDMLTGDLSTNEGRNTAFKAWISANNLQILYELATPITYQLTPQELNTLLGTNNIYCDTGDSDIKYRADIDLYIQKKIAEG